MKLGYYRDRDCFPGQEKVFHKFLWFPKCLPVGSFRGNLEWRWMCPAYIRCRYEWNRRGFRDSDGWTELYFVE
jgi:hypothetical protein